MAAELDTWLAQDIAGSVYWVDVQRGRRGRVRASLGVVENVDGQHVLPRDPASPGAHGSQVIFIHPKSCDGVLIEINQPAAAEH